jgi:putative nucleotidyltransferase with HDIG domain
MNNSASITYCDESGQEKVCELRSKIFRIGRFIGNDLALDNPYVSRVHLEIVRVGFDYKIHDLGSTSGTYLNGEQITEEFIRDGDHIHLGRGRGIELVFHSHRITQSLGAESSGEEVPVPPLRVITPEQARFINTSTLPTTGELEETTVEWLRALYEFAGESLKAQSPKELCEKIVTFMRRTLKPQRCAVMLYDRKRGMFKVTSRYYGNDTSDFHPSRSIAERVFNENVAVLSFDARRDERFSGKESIRLQDVRSVMSAPIGSHSRVLGVCYVDNLTAERTFNAEELDFLTAVARQAGMALENLYLIDEQRRMLESFIHTLAASIDARDDNTSGHSARVAAYSMGIARMMGLDQAQSRMIYYAGLLHDYGKIGTRDAVLLKPGKLTPEEYEHVKEHPLHTLKILSKIRFPEEWANIPLVAAAHHERWDGTGYPDGLKGEEIPLGSRIVAIADAYDALVEDRVYSKGIEPRAAVEQLKKATGTFFDPKVVEGLVKYYHCEIKVPHRRLKKRKPRISNFELESLMLEPTGELVDEKHEVNERRRMALTENEVVAETM